MVFGKDNPVPESVDVTLTDSDNEDGVLGVSESVEAPQNVQASKAGVKIDDPVLKVFNGQEVEVWSRVVWKPKWAVTFSDVKRKVKGNNNSVS
ncbi:unnamed protein product [Lactuca saligna]|uniref:Uncharacterized protein n=1 Tax=Lactuca saligna TaxID=75948 RepID=A0AA35ZD75_LACSI|nr:unnamed protein product [Lactuca saligna]